MMYHYSKKIPQGTAFGTKARMIISDLFKMAKTEHLKTRSTTSKGDVVGKLVRATFCKGYSFKTMSTRTRSDIIYSDPNLRRLILRYSVD